jgi:hypothetical protein
MFEIALRMSADGPACLGQSTTLVDANGEQVGQFTLALKTQEDGGARYTDPMPIPIDVYSETTAEITVTTKAHGKTLKRVLIREVDTGETYYSYR